MFWAELTDRNETLLFIVKIFFCPEIFEILEPEILLSCAGETQ